MTSEAAMVAPLTKSALTPASPPTAARTPAPASPRAPGWCARATPEPAAALGGEPAPQEVVQPGGGGLGLGHERTRDLVGRPLLVGGGAQQEQHLQLGHRDDVAGDEGAARAPVRRFLPPAAVYERPLASLMSSS